MYIEKLNQCLKTGNFSTAIVYCDALLKENPENADVIFAKGWCLYKIGRVDDAEPFFIDAFEKTPSSLQIARHTIAYYFRRQQYHKVIELCYFCIAYHQNEYGIWNKLGISHYRLGEYESSTMAFKYLLSKAPSSAVNRSFMGLSLLGRGHYKEAFPLYENRFLADPKLNWLQCENFPMPKWQGESVQNKSLLIWSEQGLGDSIQFSRFVDKLVRDGATVDIVLSSSHGTLVDVLSTLKGVRQVFIAKDDRVTLSCHYDYHCPMMSLMGLMNLRLNNIPASVPYLSVPDNMNTTWHKSKQYKNITGLKVGLVWTTLLHDSMQRDTPDAYYEKQIKSLPIVTMQPLLALPDVHFFVLQRVVSKENQQWLSQFNVSIMSDNIRHFGDTAAMIDQLDMVISIDTSVVHLAGAMGKPTVNILPYVTDWRWQRNRGDSPWYPTMRLCQQAWKDNWEETIDRVIPLVNKAKQQKEKAEPITVW
jgi:tetratricopeptide (TPR) repeat protein